MSTYAQSTLLQPQTSRRAKASDNRKSVMDTEDVHVADCLVWRDRRRGDDGLPVPPGRVRRWYCQNYNRCDENYFRQTFCQQNHAKTGADPTWKTYGGKQCQRWHCTEQPCRDDKCEYNHCRDPDCLQQRFEPTGCNDPNCRKCQGLDPKTNRSVGYVRRTELGRAKDRGIDAGPLTYRPRPNEGSAGEAIAGWPTAASKAKRNWLLEPLATGRLALTEGSGMKVAGAGVAEDRKSRDDNHVKRHEALAGQRQDSRDLWKMPRFTNGAKPRISSFRDPDDPALPANARATSYQPVDNDARIGDTRLIQLPQSQMIPARESTYREPQGPTTAPNDDGFYRQQQQQQPQYGNANYGNDTGRQQNLSSQRANDYYGNDQAEFHSYRNDDLRRGYDYNNAQNGYASAGSY